MVDGIVVVASTFTATPIESSLASSLGHPAIAFALYGQLPQFLLAPTSVVSGDILASVALIRVEDWLRENTEVDPARLRAVLQENVEELAGQLRRQAAGAMWVVICPSRGWVATERALQPLLQAYTNLLGAKLRGVPSIRLVAWSGFASSEEDDPRADRMGQIPFTQDGFDALGAHIGGVIAPALQGSTRSQEGPSGMGDLAAFLGKLGVHVVVRRAITKDDEKLEKLLATVAAFNSTGNAKSSTEIHDLLESGESRGWMIEVRDRFGDYGSSGAILARTSRRQAFEVESLLLSCPVLGKQVEYAVLDAIVTLARREQCENVTFDYRPTGRNGMTKELFDRVAIADPSLARWTLPVGDGNARIRRVAPAPDAYTYEIAD